MKSKTFSDYALMKLKILMESERANSFMAENDFNQNGLR